MSLSAFLAENAVPVENIKFVASKRFLGEDGNPIPWEIKTITGTEDEALRKSWCQACSGSRQEEPVSEGNRL